MERTKQEFRATRERVGITHAAMARMMGVSQRSVRYWEDADSPRRPPAQAWEILDDALAAQRQVLAFGLAKVDAITKEMGHEPDAVRLPYWLGETDYLTHSTDAAHGVAGDWRMANANNLAMALILEQRYIEVEWVRGNPTMEE